MDPNAALAAILEEIRKYNRGETTDFHRVIDHFESMVEWIAKGGFPPDWKTLLAEHEALSRGTGE